MKSCVLRVTLGLTILVSASTARGEWRAEGPFVASVNSLAFDPSAPSTVYAATHAGGVWRSEDGGRTWTLPGDGLTRRGVDWVEVDPTQPSRLWAGVQTGGSGSGMWQSDDRGATWKPAGQGYKGAVGQMHAIGQPITFVPPRTILVAATNLHYRSDDGGATWTDFRVPNQDAYVFAVHPENPKIILAGGRGESLNVSRSEDGGKTWRQTGIGLGQNSIKRLFYASGDPSVVWATGGTFGAVFKSADGGNEFSPVSLPVGGTDDLFDLVPHPTRPEVLWAATEGGLFTTMDGGSTWTESDRGIGRYLTKTVAFAPGDPSGLLAGTGGTGVYRSTDGGASWTPSSDGLAGGWGERIWAHPGSPGVFAQLSVGLFRREGDGQWTELQAPFEDGKTVELDGILFDRNSPTTLYAYDTSKYWVSADGGRRWNEVEQKGPSMRDMMKGNIASAQFQSLAVDPGNPKTLYAGSWSNDSPGGAVYKTTDGGKKWEPAGHGVPNEAVLRLRSEQPGTVYALVKDEGVFRTADGGKSWSAADAGLPDADLRELVVDPTRAGHVYVAAKAGLFRTTDGGASWTKASGVEGDDVEGLAVDPETGALFASTFQGVFRSDDGGATWTSITTGLPSPDVRALAVGGNPKRLWAGVAGGSVYSRELE